MRRTERTDRFLKRAAGLRRWGNEEAERVVDLVESSGDSIAGFCKKHDLGYFRVLRWRKRLRSEAGDQESGPVLLPLRIVETENDRATKENGEAQWTVELEFGDYKARFAEGASEATMARALRAAQGLSC